MRVTNYQGNEVEIPDEIIAMANNGAIKVRMPLNEGWVTVIERSKKCMERNSHDPRPWIVCFMVENGSGGYSFSDITHHPKLGGPPGAFTRAGNMIEEYTGGRY